MMRKRVTQSANHAPGNRGEREKNPHSRSQRHSSEMAKTSQAHELIPFLGNLIFHLGISLRARGLMQEQPEIYH